jgi:hypothetical protein
MNATTAATGPKTNTLVIAASTSWVVDVSGELQHQKIAHYGGDGVAAYAVHQSDSETSQSRCPIATGLMCRVSGVRLNVRAGPDNRRDKLLRCFM